MIKIASFLVVYISLHAYFLVGAGGFDVDKVDNNYSFKYIKKAKRVNITEVLHKQSKNTNSVVIWITKDWQESWFDAKTLQNEVINKGYTPIFIFYWFRDDISPKFITDNKKKYFSVLKKFTSYIKKLDGQKVVILNPEYNENGVELWDGMNDIFLKSFKIVREDKQVLVGPCVGDFGNYNFINETKEWIKFDKSLNRAVKKADFIAFQEMRALTRNSKADMLKTPKRALNLAKYLHKKYKKPTLLAYVAVSSYGKDGEKIQADIFKGFAKNINNMKKDANLIFFGLFHYFDYLGHVGYFKEAESFFGVLRKDGTKKPSFKYYNKLQ